MWVEWRGYTLVLLKGKWLDAQWGKEKVYGLEAWREKMLDPYWDVLKGNMSVLWKGHYLEFELVFVKVFLLVIHLECVLGRRLVLWKDECLDMH